MKVKISMVYLVVLVLSFLAVGTLTGIYGVDIGVWVSYSLLGMYGIMILINSILIEKIAGLKVETYYDKKITTEQIKDLPNTLGKREEKEVGESTLESVDVPDKVEQETEEPKEVKLSEEDAKRANKVALYIKDNLEKGHKLDKIKEILEKAYTKEFIEFVIQNAFKEEEPQLPDMGVPEESVTSETLNAEIAENKEQHEATENLKKTKEGVKCPKCGKTCKSKGSLKNHRRLSKKCQSS